MDEGIRELVRLNPWWENTNFSKLLGTERELLGKLDRAMKTREVLVLVGPRRAGKTTLFFQLIRRLLDNGVPARNILYVSLDNFNIKNSFEKMEDILVAYREHANPAGPVYIFLDEIQEYDEWERQIRTIYDRNNEEKLLLTSSSALFLSRQKATLLTGRNITYELRGLNFGEFLKLKNVEPAAIHAYEKLLPYLQEYLLFGAYPEIVGLDPERKKEVLRSYFSDVMFKDVLRFSDLKDSSELEKVAYFCMKNTAQRWSYRKIGSALGTNVNTTIAYVQALKKSLFLSEAEFYSGSIEARLRKEKKVYVSDTGLRNAFFPVEDYGPLAETVVFHHLRAQGATVYYYLHQKETDFVVETPSSRWVVEVKYQNKVSSEDIHALQKAMDEMKVKKGVLVSKKDEGTTGGVEIIPLAKFLIVKRVWEA